MHRVLICEDDPLLAADLASIVEEAGHAVCGVFHDARAALDNTTELARISRSSISTSPTATPALRSLRHCSRRVFASSSFRGTRMSGPG